jgi:hypothetical protein
LKQATILLLGAAMQRYEASIGEEQEVLLWIADLAIDAYAVESAVIRAIRVAGEDDGELAASHRHAALIAASEAALRADAILHRALPAVLDGDSLRIASSGARRILKLPLLDQRPWRQALAAVCIARPGAVFGESTRHGMLAG